jgi:hypothetical protein
MLFSAMRGCSLNKNLRKERERIELQGAEKCERRAPLE